MVLNLFLKFFIVDFTQSRPRKVVDKLDFFNVRIFYQFFARYFVYLFSDFIAIGVFFRNDVRLKIHFVSTE